jgi:hypothetical protein
MKSRAPLSTLIAFTLVSIGSLGVSDCSESIGRELITVVAEHEQRIDVLERCDCEGVLAPVCGENGKTYINRCEARCARTEVVSIGRCERPECGGPRGIACEEGKFCDTHPGCDAMAPGMCEEIPEVCTDEYAPVCGCDGKTYSNDCNRRAAAVPLDFRGECSQPPIACDTNADCGDDAYCHKRDGACDTHPGACAPRPDACTLDYNPVCGCDGETYSNPCAAAAAGISVEHDGECEPGPVACDDNADCEASDFCHKRTGECQSEGLCAPRPEVCPLFIAPVCGCDARNYDNECAASAAGVSLASHEACTPPGVPICHVPPGNPSNRHTITVGESAVPAHLRHGDHRGPCEDDPSE